MQVYSYIVAGFFIIGIVVFIIMFMIAARKAYKESQDIISVLFLTAICTLLVGLIFIIINSVKEGDFLTSTKSSKECVCKDTR